MDRKASRYAVQQLVTQLYSLWGRRLAAIHICGTWKKIAPGRRCSSIFLCTAVVFAGTLKADFQEVDRPDPMHNHMLAASDMRGDRVRVAYMSMPSRVQAASPDWTVNLYVAELGPDGIIRNRTVLSGQRTLATAILRHGHDEVFVMPSHENQPGEPILEVHPVPGGAMIGSFRSSLLGRGAFGQQTIFPTTDGNFFSALTSARMANQKGPNTVTWTKLSPTGVILGQGSFTRPTAESYPGGGFPARDGGIGLTLALRTAGGSESLETDLPTPVVREVGGRRLEARVFSETFLLTTDATGGRQTLSPALMRDLMWGGEMAIPADLPPNEMLAQNAEQMRVMAQTMLEHSGDRTIASLSYVQLHQVRPTAAGYGMLVHQVADRRLDPPRHGAYFVEVGFDGSLRREIYLEPAAERLDAEIDHYLPAPDGGVVVAGPRGQALHVTSLDAGGDIVWTALLSSPSMELDDIAGSADRPWAYGHTYSEELGKTVLWVEQVTPDLHRDLSEVKREVAEQASPPALPSMPVFEMPAMPEPQSVEGCDCTCDEFARIEADTEKMQSATQAEQMAMISDPQFMSRMQCMAGCAMRYAECGD